jgi:hypothetical protein
MPLAYRQYADGYRGRFSLEILWAKGAEGGARTVGINLIGTLLFIDRFTQGSTLDEWISLRISKGVC